MYVPLRGEELICTLVFIKRLCRGTIWISKPATSHTQTLAAIAQKNETSNDINYNSINKLWDNPKDLLIYRRMDCGV